VPGNEYLTNNIIDYRYLLEPGYDGHYEINPTYVYEEPGEYTVSLTVTDSCGNTESESIQIVVDPN
jgi:hypothetical protein